MNKPKVSVIMSAYNVEDSVKRAIDSVLNQTLTDFEFVIVNDCSTDKTDEIICEYTDPRITYLKHLKNRGCGWARYTGIKAAKGEYIAFLDSDDWYANDYLETLVKYAEEYKADAICSGRILCDGQNIVKEQKPKLTVLGPNDNKLISEESGCSVIILQSMFKRELFDEVDYSKLRYNDDGSTNTRLLLTCKKRVLIPYAGYYYNDTNPLSLTNTTSEARIKLHNILSIIEVEEYAREHGIQVPFMAPLIGNLVALKSLDLTEEDIEANEDEMAKCFAKILKYLQVNNPSNTQGAHNS